MSSVNSDLSPFLYMTQGTAVSEVSFSKTHSTRGFLQVRLLDVELLDLSHVHGGHAPRVGQTGLLSTGRQDKSSCTARKQMQVRREATLPFMAAEHIPTDLGNDQKMNLQSNQPTGP